MADSTPVWFWLPGQDAPTLIAELRQEGGAKRWLYQNDYLDNPGWLAPDPVQLGKANRTKGVLVLDADGLPGVLRDAAPAGYGADRLDAQAGRELSPLERLERGPADGVGALEACMGIERKLGWRPHAFSELEGLARALDEEAPSSRAIRQLRDGNETSAGGERPKVTVHAEGRWWLAKMRDRNDIPWLPAKEFVAMSLARDLDGQVDLQAPRFRHVQAGAHAIFLIERFDRTGVGSQALVAGAPPARLPFASAHTVLRLDAVFGDPGRSYLALADELCRWARTSPWLAADRAELWRRMATNALLGNTDDHPRNHGLLLREGHWRLAPLFDVTPVAKERPVLRMAVGIDGSAVPTVERLLGAAGHFGVDIEAGAAWLLAKSRFIAQNWQQRLRELGVPDAEIARTAPAFGLAEELAQARQQVEAACDGVRRQLGKRRRRPRG
ncbi:MAG: HipA domain-containing protein [Roseateles sp.]|uniref:type II toxin-antitoxin system HipA family toxin n=1 Tax=Roseateles sp. TaxID=1971397 RepID=UPI0039E7D13A